MSRRSSAFAALMLAGAALAAASVGQAQLLPSLPVGGVGLPPVARDLPVAGPVLQSVLSPSERQAATLPSLDRVVAPGGAAGLPAASLLDLRRLRLRELLRTHAAELEAVEGGQPVRRGVLIAIDPTDEQLVRARAAGFPLVTREDLGGLVSVTLRAPANLPARAALRRLRNAVPGIAADLDHVYEPAGGPLLASAAALASGAMPAMPAGRTLVMIDGGVASHPSLAGAAIAQQGFAGPAKATGHGTAVASLLVGNQSQFRGAARGARLFVADVYGGRASAGSASTIVRALAWGASKQPDAISISLVGPSNALLQRAVSILGRRGIRMVAAVGNDGPAAPIQYPAGYAGVVAVTAVDGRDRALPEAGRAARLDFAAPGADMAAALPGQGYARVRGTSFATPLVAARLAATGNPQALTGEVSPGRGKVGRGIVCRPCRIDPNSVGAK